MKKKVSVLLIMFVAFSLSAGCESKTEESKAMDYISTESTSQANTEKTNESQPEEGLYEFSKDTGSDNVVSAGERKKN